MEEALEEIQSRPPPRDLAPYGCLVALPAFVMLLVFPVIGRRFGLPQGIATIVLVVGIVLLVVGLGLWFIGGGLARGHPTAAAEAALRALESWRPGDGDRTEALRAATLLLVNAVAMYGPTMSSTFKADEARPRIEHMMPLVMAVERELLRCEAIYPVFTDAPDPGPTSRED